MHLSKKELEKRQKKLDSLKLNIKFRATRQIESLVDIIWMCMKGYDSYLTNTETYYEGTSKTQCRGGAARSIDDIYRLAKAYSISVSYSDLYKAIKLLKDNGCINQWYCSTVKKLVHGSPYASKETITIHLEKNNLNPKTI